MIRIALVDDDEDFLRSLAGHVESYPGWDGAPPVIQPFSSADDFWPAFEYQPFDLVILDVVMPGRSGLEIARRLYEIAPRVVLAFISSSVEFAAPGYGVDAVAYLIKPVERPAVHRLIQEALGRHLRRVRGQVLLKTGRATTTRINPDDVIYLESDNKRVNFHGRDQVAVYAGKLDDFLSQLPPNFVQVHKSYAVNLDHVQALRPQEMVTANGRSIPVSRRFRARVERLYLVHVAGEV